MTPKPLDYAQDYHASGKLKNKKTLITGGDSDIGRAAAIVYAREGADVAIIYLNEHDDARETRRLVEQEDRRCLLFAGDVGDEEFCRACVEQTVEQFGRIDVLVNNSGEQHAYDSIQEISAQLLERTFRTNIVLHPNGGRIING